MPSAYLTSYFPAVTWHVERQEEAPQERFSLFAHDAEDRADWNVVGLTRDDLHRLRDAIAEALRHLPAPRAPGSLPVSEGEVQPTTADTGVPI